MLPAGHALCFAGRAVRATRFVGILTLAIGLGSVSACGDDDPVVVDSQVASVDVIPARTTLELGATLNVQLVARKDDGERIEGLTASWESSNPTAATVSSTGVVTATASCSSLITGSIGVKKAV